MTESTGGARYPIESVDRALSVILAFEESESLTIAEIARRLGVSRSTAYRLLSVLEHRGFVRQDPRTKRFHGGMALLRVGLAAARRSDIRATLRPTLEAIVTEVNETGHIVVLDGADAFFLDCVESSKTIRAASRVGTSLPAHVTASGKVLLAHLPAAERDRLIGRKLVAATPQSQTSVAALRRELETIRTRGWATNDGESEPGLRAVAVFVDNIATQTGIDAAITVAGPADRIHHADLERIAQLLTRHTATLVN
jgi:IclR family acetate operon transcriptional repressor